MLEIWDSIVCLMNYVVRMIFYYMVESVEFVLDVLAVAVNAALFLLPHVEFDDPQADQGVLGALNYVFPVNYFAGLFSTVMVAWVAYRVYQWLLKWVQVAD